MSEDTDKGTVEVEPISSDNKYAQGSKIRLTASAKQGYELEGWYNGSTKLSEFDEYDYEVGTSNVTITAKFKVYIKYGKTVTLGTVTANGVAMTSGWKYFLEDTNNIYLMYGNYLENVQIPTGTFITKNRYNVTSSQNRGYLYSYLKGTENFGETGKTYYFSNSDGSINLSSTGKTISIGYLFTRDNTETTKKWEKSLPSGYMKTLAGWPGSGRSNMYYPHANDSMDWQSCSGYWLAGLSADSSTSLLYVGRVGVVWPGTYDGNYFGVAPVVLIPKSEIVDIKAALGI